jgi:lipopolysaccharide transport system permease protein
VLPLVSVFSSLVNYLLSLPMMFLVMAVVQLLFPPLRDQGRLFNFAPTIAYLPVLVIIQTLFLAGVALLISALAVHFRDFVHLIGILLQFWFFLTPVVYSLDVVHVSVGGVPLAQVVRWLNPMASLIEFYREVLYGNTVYSGQVPTPGLPALTSVLRVLVTALVVLAAGYWFFQRRSRQFGEEI